MEARLMTIQDAAQQLAVSTDSVRRMVKASQLRAVRVLRRVLIPVSEIQRVCSGTGTSTAHTSRQRK